MLPETSALKVASLLRQAAFLNAEILALDKILARRLAEDLGYRAVQTIPGIGPVFAAVIVAEIGDIHRFAGPGPLCSWAGLTPRHRASDLKVHRGRITKQGSSLLRWACVEAVQRSLAGTPAGAGRCAGGGGRRGRGALGAGCGLASAQQRAAVDGASDRSESRAADIKPGLLRNAPWVGIPGGDRSRVRWDGPAAARVADCRPWVCGP
ncbi:transposase [Streptomyces violascens]|uniref:transposase n=1 Tax=Streptomyces violascens TaxID=67381 RepID=UPI0036464BA6